MNKLGIAVIASVILIAAAGCGRKPAGKAVPVTPAAGSVSQPVVAPETPRPPAESVLEPDKLFSEYNLNKRDGALKYYGRMLTLKTKAGQYKTDCYRSLVTFELLQGANGPEGVQCRVQPGCCRTAASAGQGKEVEITGRCQGFDGTFVTLDRCTVTVR